VVEVVAVYMAAAAAETEDFVRSDGIHVIYGYIFHQFKVFDEVPHSNSFEIVTFS
jgi:hypothetical protein